VSDVWQGPGWWLASDGKWYPADAEPGAVYQGDISKHADEAAASPEVSTVSDDADVFDTPFSTNDLPTSDISSFSTEASTFDTTGIGGASTTPSTDTTAFAPAPDPVIDEVAADTSIGGWQAISPEPTTPVAESVASVEPDAEDGWTSAYEERNSTSEILSLGKDLPDSTIGVDPAAPIPDLYEGSPAINTPGTPTIPDFEAPATNVPDMSMPAPGIPDVGVPEMSMPAPGIPDVGVPEMSMPSVDVPDVSVPDMSLPDVDIAETPAIPDITMPAMDVPAVDVPEMSMPAVDVPEMSMPAVDVPDMSMPAVDVPDMSMPAATIPDVTPSAVTRTGTTPIERDAAWRSPRHTPLAETPVPTAEAPTVVDLAVPQDFQDSVTPTPTKRKSGPLLAGILGLAVLIGLAVVIINVLGGDDDGGSASADTSQDSAVVEDAPTTLPPDDTGDGINNVSVFELRAGDCIVGDIGSGQVTEVTKVECEEEHQFEVYREVLIDSSITSFDETAISAYAEDVCRTSLEAYVPATDPRGLMFKFLQPTEDSWNQAEEPDRVITCLLFDDDEPLVGRAA